jgi:hypothetical protein
VRVEAIELGSGGLAAIAVSRSNARGSRLSAVFTTTTNEVSRSRIRSRLPSRTVYTGDSEAETARVGETRPRLEELSTPRRSPPNS